MGVARDDGGAARADVDAAVVPAADRQTTTAEDEDLETRLVRTFRDKWSINVERGALHVKLRVPEGTKVKGCDFAKYGFEVYSIAALTAGPGRLYLEGGIAIDGSAGLGTNHSVDLEQLRSYLSVPDDVQRALVVKFWVGTRDNKVRYLVGERLWDDSW